MLQVPFEKTTQEQIIEMLIQLGKFQEFSVVPVLQNFFTVIPCALEDFQL